MSRTTLKAFKEEALQNSEVAKEYEVLRPEYEIKRKLIVIRKEAGLTQEKLADLMGTKKEQYFQAGEF